MAVERRAGPRFHPATGSVPLAITRRSFVPFIMMPCPCGRILRAKPEQVGTEIRCWSCHQTTLVKIPRVRQRVLAQCLRNTTSLLNGSETNRIVLAAALLTVGFMIPYAGLGVAMVLMIAGAAAYGDLIQSSHTAIDQLKPDWMRIWRQTRLSQKMVCVLFAVGTTVSLWVSNASRQDSPHLTVSTAIILGLAWIVLPVIMAATYAEPDQPNARTRDRFLFVLIHPLTLLIVLLMVPAFLIVLEALLGWILYIGGVLPLFALDFMPVPGLPRFFNGVPVWNDRSFFELPVRMFHAGYLAGLRHGYSFIAGVPPSLSLPTNAGINPSLGRMTPVAYYLIRVAIVFIISLILTMSFAIQARCLNVLINVRRYLAS